MHMLNLDELTKSYLDGNLFDRLFHDFLARRDDLKRGLLYVGEPPSLAECAPYVYECHNLLEIFKDLTTNCTILENECYNGYKDYDKLENSKLIKSI
ncbi:uncharacterized protein T551_01855 [Pneumocystis jirovecii RU7]|uniref:Uncharacterized protein n=1 Tax=Pneumocystis jirovecii (strain RU7) TaxID=1408657 RepID=A0A0W4ZQB2_PNEJ7|nr:uncharacterized protein T551_01855 [Pneumocystis jirovecii RU7]KTW30572.1 hypothetical protein T551_01855 [Pneumocystis jirovecii RU7]